MVTLVQVVVSGLLLGGVYALLAGGLTLIFGVMRVINLAHGEFLMLGAYASFFLFARLGLNPILSLFLSLPLTSNDFLRGNETHPEGLIS